VVTQDRRAASRAKRIMSLEKGDLSYLVEQRLE
jgi:putative ABC transport system ATP-binding protein